MNPEYYSITSHEERPTWEPVFPAWPFEDESVSYTLYVNGQRYPVESAWLGESLLFVLRERLGLPGSKNACEQGECGSCLVQMDGMVVCSCCILAADAADAEITTIEAANVLGASDIQKAMVEEGAVQCGFCTPGFVMAIADLLEHTPEPDSNVTRECLSGNLCRCTGYGRILAAVEKVASDRKRSRARVGDTK